MTDSLSIWLIEMWIEKKNSEAIFQFYFFLNWIFEAWLTFNNSFFLYLFIRSISFFVMIFHWNFANYYIKLSLRLCNKCEFYVSYAAPYFLTLNSSSNLWKKKKTERNRTRWNKAAINSIKSENCVTIKHSFAFSINFIVLWMKDITNGDKNKKEKKK